MKMHKNRELRSVNRRSIKTFGFFGGVAMLLLLGSVQLKIAPIQSDGWVVASFDEAVADSNRRVARRTSRRTSHRN